MHVWHASIGRGHCIKLLQHVPCHRIGSLGIVHRRWLVRLAKNFRGEGQARHRLLLGSAENRSGFCQTGFFILSEDLFCRRS